MNAADIAVQDAIKMGLFLRRLAQMRFRNFNRTHPAWIGQASHGLDSYRFDMRDAMRCIQRAKYWKGKFNGKAA